MKVTQLVWVSQGSFKTTYGHNKPKGKSSREVVFCLGGEGIFSFFLFLSKCLHVCFSLSFF